MEALCNTRSILVIKVINVIKEGCAKAQDGWPPTPHCTSWLKGLETEINTAGLDLKGLVPSYLLTYLHLGHNIVLTTWRCFSANKSRNLAQTVSSLLPSTHCILMPTNFMLLLVNKLYNIICYLRGMRLAKD